MAPPARRASVREDQRQVLAERVQRVVAELGRGAGLGGRCPSASWSARPRRPTATTPRRSACSWRKSPSSRPARWPRSCASRLLADPDVAALVEKVEIAGPGFLNFTLSGAAYAEAMAEMLGGGRDDRPGRSSAASPGQPGVRQRQSQRSSPRGPRPLRGLRRRAPPAAGVQRRQRLHRVLHQRLRPADGPLRPQRGRPLRAVLRRRPPGAGGRLPGRVRQGHRRRPSGPRWATATWRR